MANPVIVSRLQQIMLRVLKLESTLDNIDPERNYFQGEFGLSSLDALELLVHIEREFDVEIEDGYIRMLPNLSLNSLADYIEHIQTKGGP